jgi:hypothetical protein
VLAALSTRADFAEDGFFALLAGLGLAFTDDRGPGQ